MIQSKEVRRFEFLFLNFSCLHFWHGTFDEGSREIFILRLCTNCSFPCRLLVLRLLDSWLNCKGGASTGISNFIPDVLITAPLGNRTHANGALLSVSTKLAREIYITCIYANIRISESCDMGSCDRLHILKFDSCWYSSEWSHLQATNTSQTFLWNCINTPTG